MALFRNNASALLVKAEAKELHELLAHGGPHWDTSATYGAHVPILALVAPGISQ